MLGCYCRITRSYSPIDPYEFVQFSSAKAIYEFAAKLLAWEWRIAETHVNFMRRELDDVGEMMPGGSDRSDEQLKGDLLETLHFIIDRLYQAAAAGRVVAVIGI